jgi:hypothetical protein
MTIAAVPVFGIILPPAAGIIPAGNPHQQTRQIESGAEKQTLAAIRSAYQPQAGEAAQIPVDPEAVEG